MIGWFTAGAVMLGQTSNEATISMATTPFPYPQAPDTCSNLESRCNYIVDHFWDAYDVSRPISDTIAFETAFRDYVDFFRYAHRNVVMASVKDFVFKAQANAANLRLVGRVAERSLYGTEAQYWSDEVYVAFIKPLVSSKQLSKDERNHYKGQLELINANQVGMELDFEFTTPDGTKRRLSDITAESYILLFLGDNIDSNIGRVRLSTDVSLNALLDAGKAALVCITLRDYDATWASAAAGYNSNWIVGCSGQLRVDVRGLPCCYVLDGQRKIANKSLTIEHLKSVVSPY